jgi:hypothetical protein
MDNVHDGSNIIGLDLVEPQNGHLDHKNLPESVQPGAKFFDKKVVNAKRRPKQPSMCVGGISPKCFYRVGKGPGALGRVMPSTSFMVKPYFEDFQGWEGADYPISGFSEMATQGLMHAAGLGDSACRVHTFADPQHGNKPLLAVEFQPEYRDVSSLDTKYSDGAKDTLARIGVIDYLTNHQDRHSSNLMAQPTRRGKLEKVLSIDNGRSFQYRIGQRHSYNSSRFDHLFFHLFSPAIKHALYTDDADQSVDPNKRYKQFLNPDRFTGLMSWWKERRGEIVKSFEEHLKTVVSPEAKEWISSNFMERVKSMDKVAAYWGRSDKKKAQLWSLDPKHASDKVGRNHKFAVNPVRYNEHGEQYRGEGYEDDLPEPTW